MPTNVEIPPLGESVSEAVLLRWLKEEGQFVNANDPTGDLETDKANVDLPAPSSGVLRRAKQPGDTVHIGETIARIDEAAAGASAPAASAAAPAKPAAPPQPPAEVTAVRSAPGGGVARAAAPAATQPASPRSEDLRPS